MKNTKADCYGQKFGHDYAGGVCLKCGGEQNPFKKPDSFSRALWSGLENRIRRKVNTRIHSELHELVDKARKDFGETATKGKGSFGFYLRMLKRVPTSTCMTTYIKTKCHNCGVELTRRKGITSAICFDCRNKNSRDRNIAKKLKALFAKPL